MLGDFLGLTCAYISIPLSICNTSPVTGSAYKMQETNGHDSNLHVHGKLHGSDLPAHGVTVVIKEQRGRRLNRDQNFMLKSKF